MAWLLPDDCVLGVFGSRPDPKDSLPALTVEFGGLRAAEIAGAMLFDAIDVWGSDNVLSPGGRRVLVFAPEDAGHWFDERVPASFALQAQCNVDFGLKLRTFFEGEFTDGAKRVVVIRSDTPLLDPSMVISAFLCLEGRDVVLGPATNGGYYLVGCRNETPPIFDGIEWNSANVLSQTIDRLNETGSSLAILPPNYTIETPMNLRMLAGHIRALRRTGLKPDLPRVEEIVEQTLPRQRRCAPTSFEA